MTDLSDERIRFYLKHRTQIEAWAALKKEAAAAIDELLEGLADDVHGLADDLNAVVVARLEGETHPRFLLYRREWWPDPKSARGTIAIEWTRGKTLLDGAASPYVGTRFAVSHEPTRALRDAFRDATQTLRTSRNDRTSPWWPAYRTVPADPGFCDDFQPYRERLLGELRSAWRAYADVMQRVLLGPVAVSTVQK